MIPNFFIIGAPKCGTTALASYLTEHYQIFFSKSKEPHFFSDDIHWQRIANTKKYLSLFEKANATHLAIGEGSVFYLFSKNAVKKIVQFNPDAKFIVMLRNPIELVESLYYENRKSGTEKFDKFSEAWRARLDRRIHPVNRNPYSFQYEDIAKLGQQLERLYREVDRNKVHTILYDDFAKNPGAIYRSVLSFLGVNDDGRIHFNVVNVKQTYRSMLLNRIITNISDLVGISSGLRKPLKKLSDVVRYFNYSKESNASIQPELKEELITVFRDDILLLEQLLGRDLSDWRK